MRLIDAYALQEEYKARHGGKRLLLIDVAPTVDAVPVRNGKWDFLGDNQFRCTCCDAFYTGDQFEAIRMRKDDPYEPNFCPNCGADMRGEQDEL